MTSIAKSGALQTGYELDVAVMTYPPRTGKQYYSPFGVNVYAPRTQGETSEMGAYIGKGIVKGVQRYDSVLGIVVLDVENGAGVMAETSGFLFDYIPIDADKNLCTDTPEISLHDFLEHAVPADYI